MSPPKRPKRYIVIPKAELAQPVTGPLHAMRLMRLSPAAVGRNPVARAAARPAPVAAPGLKVVNASPPDGAVLVEGKNLSAAQVKAKTPAGTQVVEEQWYRLNRPARPWLKLSNTLKTPRTVAGQTMAWQINVSVATQPRRKRLKDVRITVMTDSARGIGAEALTDRYGRATISLSARTTRVDAIYIEPLHGAWPLALQDLDVSPAGMSVDVMPIDLSARDVRNLAYGQPAASAGKGVAVAVIDTGVGKHAALKVAGGRNTTTAESPSRYRDEDGHGSHVAGVISAAASGWRRGEASAAKLYAYRIFEAGDEYASTFAISTAIKQAALDGCDLINLSIGDSMADESVRNAVEVAWSMGSVCVAATGNDGRNQVDYPARYPQAIAVSAIGLENSWPAGAFLEWTFSASHGKTLGGLRSFCAGFSNRGAKVALTAPGVAVVSTIFDNRWGVMSGTSMATPIATGVLARRLAASPVLGMPRDAARAAAIVALAGSHAEDMGLPRIMQGRGLAR